MSTAKNFSPQQTADANFARRTSRRPFANHPAVRRREWRGRKAAARKLNFAQRKNRTTRRQVEVKRDCVTRRVASRRITGIGYALSVSRLNINENKTQRHGSELGHRGRPAATPTPAVAQAARTRTRLDISQTNSRGRGAEKNLQARYDRNFRRYVTKAWRRQTTRRWLQASIAACTINRRRQQITIAYSASG